MRTLVLAAVLVAALAGPPAADASYTSVPYYRSWDGKYGFRWAVKPRECMFNGSKARTPTRCRSPR